MSGPRIIRNIARHPGQAALCIAAVVAAAVTGIAIPALAHVSESSAGNILNQIALIAALCVFSLASYVAWPSRWNVVAHLQVGFCVSAYIIPVLVVGVTDQYPARTLRLYTVMCVLGAAVHLLGVIAGRLTFDSLTSRHPLRLPRPSEVRLTAIAGQRAGLLVALGAVGLAASFYVIGFVPILAEDPLQAKFLKGAYQNTYAQVAYLYRTSLYTLSTLLPVVLITWWLTRRPRLLLLAAVAAVLLAGAGNRGPALTGLALFVGLLCARDRRTTIMFVAGIALLYPFVGSTLFYLLGSVAGSFQGIYADTDIFQVIASGTPDVSDHLLFLDRFLPYQDFTYGRTFYGGLIPFQYRWSPAVWTLGVLYPGVDSNATVSGGLRLPVAIWGFTAFGWPGVVGLSSVSGFLLGLVSRLAAREVGNGSLLRSTALLTLYITVGTQIATFYLLSIYSLPAIAVAVAVAWPWLAESRSVGKAGPKVAAGADLSRAATVGR